MRGRGSIEGGKRWVAALVVVTAALSMAAAVATARAAQSDLVLVSRAAGTNGIKGDGHSGHATTSGDGRFVTFASAASNLHPDDADTDSDVYVRDLQTGATTLVSRATGATGAKGNAWSYLPAISADGRYVTFVSSGSNLHPDDPDAVEDVYVRDLHTATTTLVSRATGAVGAKGNSTSDFPEISADGRFVTFQSVASNLHPDDADTESDVYVRDLQTGATTLASRATGTTGAKGNGYSYSADISADGRFVAFASLASNLHPEDSDKIGDVYVRDLETGASTLASRATGATGEKGNLGSGLIDDFSVAISADGRFVAFASFASNLHADDTDETSDVYVRDLQTATTALASRATGATGAKGNFGSILPAISADGRFVTFGSLASNLHADDTDETWDVYVRDLQTGATTLVSRATGATGAKGNASSYLPAISADGRFVTFGSLASNLHADDTDGIPDIFVRDVLGPPSPDPTPSPAPGPRPTPVPPGACENGIDDDRDGRTDDADPECAAGRGREDRPDNPLLACAGGSLVLTDVLPARRRRVRLAGFADRVLAGRHVLLFAGRRRIARARVAADGSFATSARAARNARTRYQARIGELRSRALKLDRKAVGAKISLRDGTVALSGRVIAAKRLLRGARVELLLGRPGECNAFAAVARRKLPKSGRFTISAPAPADRAVAVYRARIRLRDQTTYTLPRVVFLR